MTIVDLSVRRPVSVFIFAVAAVVFGSVAFTNLPLDLLPDISYPSLTVRTEYEGAAPIEIESLVTRPVENAVGVVNGVTRVTSSSRTDVSEVTLEFAWGTTMDLAALDVRERLDVLQLPTEADRPVLLRYDPSLDPILRIGATDEPRAGAAATDLIRLRLFAEEEIKRALERIEGVAAVVVSGGLEEEIQVELDEQRIAGLGLSVDRVLERLASENVNLTGGRLRQGRTEYVVRTISEYTRPADLRPVIVDASEGAIVRLDDVAEVRRGHREREVVTRIDGRESVELAVYKEGGTNTVAVSDAVRAGLAELRTRLGETAPDLRLTVVTDQARYIRDSVREVLQTAIWGGLLAILVLFLFLRSWKTTLIIGVAIPISVVSTFFLMYATGISLNIMSLGGLTLGIGLLVDNSIVVLESIQRRRDEGLPDDEAARVGTARVGRAVVASTLTTICVFVPIVFVEGVAGQLFGDQALTVTVSLAVSLVVALTVIPMLASRRFAPGPTAAAEPAGAAGRGMVGRATFAGALAATRAIRAGARLGGRALGALTELPLRGFHAVFDRVAAVYGRALDMTLRRPVVPIVIALGLLAAGLALWPTLGRELFPELVQGEFYVDVELPPGTPLEATERRLARMEAAALEHVSGVSTVYSIAGASNTQGGTAGEQREHIGQLTIALEPPVSAEREATAIASLRELLERDAGLEYRFGRPTYFSFRTPIEVEIRGFNLALLERMADAAASRMKAIDGLGDVQASTEGGTPELRIRFDRERLAGYGLSVGEVAETVRTKLQGRVATDLQREDRTIDIRLRAAEQYRDSAADLLAFTVHQAGNVALPLSSVATIDQVEGPAEIRRAEGDRVAVVSASLVGVDLETAARAIEAELTALSWPPGLDWTLGGQRREMTTSFDSMRLAIALAIFMVYLVMASQFESLLHPFVILFSVPFAAIGVLGTLRLFDVNISIAVLIGTILLAGIVVNNAIILVDSTNRFRRDDEMTKVEALRRAGRVRLRPILMTTATTVLGLLPMAIGIGAGSELRRPMALSVIGGLLSSTLLTLLIVPAVYRLLDRGR